MWWWHRRNKARLCARATPIGTHNSRLSLRSTACSCCPPRSRLPMDGGVSGATLFMQIRLQLELVQRQTSCAGSAILVCGKRKKEFHMPRLAPTSGVTNGHPRLKGFVCQLAPVNYGPTSMLKGDPVSRILRSLCRPKFGLSRMVKASSLQPSIEVGITFTLMREKNLAPWIFGLRTARN